MHTAVLFDTLSYAKKLKSAGFTDAQAEIQAEALAEIIEQRLATKQDVLELKRDLKEMEQRIIIKLGAMVAASIAITVTLLKAL
jgi:hypothetical protein